MEARSPISFQAKNAVRSPLGHVSLAGFLRNSLGVPRRPLRVLGSYAVVFVVDGGGRYEDANGLVLGVEAGDLLLVFPDLPHTYGPDGDSRWTELFFVFDGPVFDLWRSAGLLDPKRPVHRLQPVEYWAARFESILGAPRQPGHAPSLIEVCRLQMIMSEALLDGTRGGEQDQETAWVARACALLETDLHYDVDLPELAREMGMSYDGFRKRFRRRVGVPPARYRGARVIDRACELMQQGNLTDRQIAERLGFCDEFYFSRRFKQVTGRSPREFRVHLPRAG